MLTQQVARELKERYDHLILVCGHYEGVDQRFLDECVDEEISMGDFVVTGGEIPAMALADCLCVWCRACCRRRAATPTRATGTACWSILSTPSRGVARPQGAGGAAQRSPRQRGGLAHAESYKRTMARRPDLWEKFDLTQVHSRHDKKVLAQALAEYEAAQRPPEDAGETESAE